MIKKLLIIPDCHAHPDYDNNRFDWLGNLIVEERPDTILCLGDLADMPSLSSYDKGTKGFEGRRYKHDIASALDAQVRLFTPLIDYNAKQAKNRKTRYIPHKIILGGNHEFGRINKAINNQAELEGTISTDDLGYNLHWDKIVDYNDKVIVAGFTCSHYLPSGVMGRPISGDNAAANLINKMHTGCIVGHSHLLDISIRTDGKGHKLLGVVAGCYVHPDMIEEWNKAQAALWWNGVIMLHDAHDGYAESIQTITQKQVYEQYS